MIRRTTLMSLAMAGVLALGLGLGAWWFHRAPLLEIAGVYWPDPRPLDEFRLIHHSGRPFSRADFEGHWTFLYFGYSYCPDVCPLTLVELNRLQRLLAERNADGDTAYVFVSVDPQRDTPQRLQDYVAYFNPKFQGVTGALDELNRLAKPLQVFYQRAAAAGNATHYAVNHTSNILLIDPASRLRATFTPPQNPERMAADFQRIRAAATP